MATSEVSFRYFWVKVVDQEGQIKDDALRLATGQDPRLSSQDFVHVIIFADTTPELTIDTVRNGSVQRDPAASSLKLETLAMGPRFSEEDARQWIDSEGGKAWKGHAQMCALHRVAYCPQKGANEKATSAEARASRLL